MTDKLPSTRDELVDLVAFWLHEACGNGLVADDPEVSRDASVLASRKFLDALTAAGLVIAPREATEEMQSAGGYVYISVNEKMSKEVYRAMRAAIPWEEQP